MSFTDSGISYFVNGQTKTFPLKVYESIKSGVAPDVNALSALILLGTIVLVVLTQSNLIKKLTKKYKYLGGIVYEKKKNFEYGICSYFSSINV